MAQLGSRSASRVALGLAALGVIAAVGCLVPRSISPTVPPPGVSKPLPLPTMTVDAPTPTAPADSGWVALRPGLEQRSIQVAAEGVPGESLYLLRLDPAAFRFAIGYAPGEPHTLDQWAAQTGALIVANGGYFTPEFTATGLIVVEGTASGASYGSFAGMFAVVDDAPQIRWLAAQPYDAAEPLDFALQSFPVLIRPDDAATYPTEDNLPARRTVIAQDRQGRVLFVLATWGGFSLHGLSQYLLGSDLDLHIALNLDGGASSGIWLAEPRGGVPALTPLPTVILVFPNQNPGGG